MDHPPLPFIVTVILKLYLLANIYILARLRSGTRRWGTPGRFLFWFMMAWALMFPLARFVTAVPLENADPGRHAYDISVFFMNTGSYYIAVMQYLLICFILFDLAGILSRTAEPFKSLSKFRNPSIKTGLALIITAVIIVPGFFAAVHPVSVYHEIEIDKNSTNKKQLRAVLISDLHLGYQIGNRSIKRIIDKVNSENPDIVLIPGDIIDYGTGILEKRGSAGLLAGLNAKYGVFASPGNHEYYGGIENSHRFLEAADITVLDDRYVTVNGFLVIAGRNDPVAENFGITRKPLHEIIEGIDRSLPLIVLDHQPVSIPEAAENGADIIASGHTHHGQLFPINYITSSIFKLSRGHKLKDNTHVFVTSGIGTWGPRVRVGSRSELVVIDITIF